LNQLKVNERYALSSEASSLTTSIF
jgi:hypothetical protein